MNLMCNPKSEFRFNPLPANVENMVSSNNASKGQIGFSSMFKGLMWGWGEIRKIKKTFIGISNWKSGFLLYALSSYP